MKQYSQNGKIPGERESSSRRRPIDEADQDSQLEAVLSDFRASVHAWSKAKYRSRALVLSPAPRRTLWRQTLAWSLCVLLTGTVVSGGLFQYHERKSPARLQFSANSIASGWLISNTLAKPTICSLASIATSRERYPVPWSRWPA